MKCLNEVRLWGMWGAYGGVSQRVRGPRFDVRGAMHGTCGVRQSMHVGPLMAAHHRAYGEPRLDTRGAMHWDVRGASVNARRVLMETYRSAYGAPLGQAGGQCLGSIGCVSQCTAARMAAHPSAQRVPPHQQAGAMDRRIRGAFVNARGRLIRCVSGACGVRELCGATDRASLGNGK